MKERQKKIKKKAWKSLLLRWSEEKSERMCKGNMKRRNRKKLKDWIDFKEVTVFCCWNMKKDFSWFNWFSVDQTKVLDGKKKIDESKEELKRKEKLRRS